MHVCGVYIDLQQFSRTKFAAQIATSIHSQFYCVYYAQITYLSSRVGLKKEENHTLVETVQPVVQSVVQFCW